MFSETLRQIMGEKRKAINEDQHYVNDHRSKLVDKDTAGHLAVIPVRRCFLGSPTMSLGLHRAYSISHQ